VIALCKAIEANDMKEIDRLLADGADVNAKGKGNMTPLLWAFHEDNPDVFKKLLEHGADPNVVVTNRFNTKDIEITPSGAIFPGESVLFLAARIGKPNYFKYVMQHGGNPNLITNDLSPPLFVLGGQYPDKKEAIQLLIDAGADLEYRSPTVSNTALESSITKKLFSITLQLLEAGASFNAYSGNNVRISTPVHAFVGEMPEDTPPDERESYAKVLEWLEINGADIEGARRDREAWSQYGQQSPARLAELKQRYEDDLAAKVAAKEQADAAEQ